MSEVHFYLINKNKEKTSLEAIIRYKGERYKMPVGESVNPLFWNPVKYRCKEVREYPEGKEINDRLKEWDKLISDIIYDFGKDLTIPTQKQFRACVEKSLDEKDPDNIVEEKTIYLTDFIQTFIDSAERSHNTIKRYITTLNMIKSYECKKRLTFDDIDMRFYNSFKKWMNSKEFKDDEGNLIRKGYSVNYFGDMIKNIRVFLFAAEEEGIQVNPGFKSKNFKPISEESDSIFLSVDELLKIHRMEITEEMILNAFPTTIVNVKHNMERKIQSLVDNKDRFLIGAFTAMRFSDYGDLDGIKSTDEYITKKRTQKTGIKVVIPMHWVIREILEKRNNILPAPISNQKLNDSLKEIGLLAGFNEMETMTITRGGKKETTQFDKFKLITTHTARRSGCTNMYLSGIDIYAIMGFSGHKTVKSFLKYIKVKQEENAIRLKDHAFFLKDPPQSTDHGQSESSRN